MEHHNGAELAVEQAEKSSWFAVWNDPEKDWAVEIGILLSELFLIFGGIIPYIPQYIEILRKRNADGFSPIVCLAIVASSSIRIAYWFGRPYDLAIFWQCFVMIVVMFVMMELYIRVKGPYREERSFLDFEPAYFWAWTNLLSYIQVTMLFTTVLIFIVLLFGWLPGVMQIIAVVALLVEASLAIPQFIRNLVNHSTEGLNKAMVCLWALGDTYKLTYYILRNVPLPFVLCVVFQLFLDMAILAQIFIYGDRSTIQPHSFDPNNIPH